MSNSDSNSPQPWNPGGFGYQPPCLADPYQSPYASPTAPPADFDRGKKFLDDEPLGPKIGWPWLAWLVILFLVGLIVLRPYIMPAAAEQNAAVGEDVVGLSLMEVQGKYFVGARDLLVMDPAQQDEIYNSATALNAGTLDQRLRYVILAGELAGADEASSHLESLGTRLSAQRAEMTPEQDAVRRALINLYTDYGQNRWDAPSLSDAHRELLKAKLGWFGALALAPSSGPDAAAREAVLSTARATLIVVVLFAISLVLLGGLGLVGLCVFVVLAMTGKVASRIQAGSNHGGVYAETFAVWMLLYLGLSIAAQFVVTDENMLEVNLAAFFASLSALIWPVLRGVSWRRVCEDIGLTIGKNIAEPFWGFVCYVCTLPLLVGGVIIMVFLMAAFGFLVPDAGGPVANEFGPDNEMPNHPILEWIAQADLRKTVLILLLACVAAPIVEETMFRGVLYRQLRDATARTRIWASVLFSGAVNSFIFAVIHPQGIFAVPPLMALAFGFSLAREWRGSLIAPMTMHALNNGAVTMLMVFLF